MECLSKSFIYMYWYIVCQYPNLLLLETYLAVAGTDCIKARLTQMQDDPAMEPGMLEYLLDHVGDGDSKMNMKELFGNMIEFLSAGVDTVILVIYSGIPWSLFSYENVRPHINYYRNKGRDLTPLWQTPWTNDIAFNVCLDFIVFIKRSEKEEIWLSHISEAVIQTENEKEIEHGWIYMYIHDNLNGH